jgi:hypothetical protein
MTEGEEDLPAVPLPEVSEEDRLLIGHVLRQALTPMLMHESLKQDIDHCEQMLSQADSQFWRRMYIRSIFAYIEASVFILKQDALYDGGKHGIQFSDAERLLLQDQSAEINDIGGVKIQKAKISFLKNLRFAFKTYARTAGDVTALKVDSIGWAAIRESLKVRDRLMHPKQVEDLLVTDQELRAVSVGYVWFLQELSVVMGYRKRIDSAVL